MPKCKQERRSNGLYFEVKVLTLKPSVVLLASKDIVLVESFRSEMKMSIDVRMPNGFDV